MKTLVYIALVCISIGYTCPCVAQSNSGSDQRSEVEDDDGEFHDDEGTQLLSVEELIDHNFYSNEVQLLLKSIGHDGSYYGDKVILRITTQPGVEISFNSYRNLNHVNYQTDYTNDLPYGLTPNMKFRKAKKQLGKKVRKSNRHTLFLNDNLLEVLVKYPIKGPRKNIKEVSLYSLRESHPCSYCDSMHAKAEEKMWNDLTEVHQASIREAEEKQRIENERAQEEALKEAERKAKEKAEYERKERERIAEYERQEEKRKEAAKNENPLCYELQSIFDEGPDFESISGSLIKEENTEFELASYYEAEKSIRGFEECSISNISNLYFMETWIKYNAKSSFTQLEEAKKLYRNVTQQILLCPNYERTESVSGSTAIVSSQYFIKAENRGYTMMKVSVFIVENRSSEFVVHLIIEE
jgi:hypothetical protein